MARTQESEKQKVSSKWRGLVSEYQPVPLFDPKSNMPHTFSKDVYERRFEEIDKCAAQSGFKLAYKTKSGHVTFVRNDKKSAEGSKQVDV